MMDIIEDNLIQTIQEAFDRRLKTVDTLPGQWSADTLKIMLNQSPAVYVAWLGGRMKNERDKEVNLQSTVVVYALTNHANSLKSQRRGTNNMIGAYEILKIVIPLLHGHKIPSAGSLTFQRVDNLFNTQVARQGFSAYAATFNCPTPLEYYADTSLLSDFAIYHAEHSLVPGPDEPNAIDNVNVPIT